MIRVKLLRLTFYSELHGTKFSLALAELLWALVLLTSSDIFNNPVYHVMSHTIPDNHAWGCIWLLSAITNFYILITGKYHDRFAVSFTCADSMLWWFTTISMYMSAPPAPVVLSGEFALSVASTWVYVRSGWIPTGARESNNV